MAAWRFLDYRTKDQETPIRDWYEAQEPKVQATFDATVEVLSKTDDWNDPDLLSFDVFTRKPEHLGLAQVKFYIVEKTIRRRDRKRHFRAIGLWRQEEREFIFLTAFEKSGRTTIPTNAFENAMKLHLQLEDGEGFMDEHI